MVSIDKRFIDDCDAGNAKAIARSYPLMVNIDTRFIDDRIASECDQH